MTEKEKMLAGIDYYSQDEELTIEINRTKDLIWEYNNIRPTNIEERKKTIKLIIPNIGENFLINQPFRCDFGSNIKIGKNFFSNFNLTILDEAMVTIGDNCFIGPNVSIYTAIHPIDPTQRNQQRQTAQPVTIGDNVWICGSVTIIPGVTIGNNVTIGAGSVVTKNIPDNCVALGNPCIPVKYIKKSR